MFDKSSERIGLHEQEEDPEAYAWDHKCHQYAVAPSLPHFRAHIEMIRYRMRRLLAAVELTPTSQNLFFLLPTLRATHAELRSLLESPCAWQDIHAADAELISRAESALRKINVP